MFVSGSLDRGPRDITELRLQHWADFRRLHGVEQMESAANQGL